MITLAKGTKENLVVDVADRLENITTLTGTSPTFDVRVRDSDTWLIQGSPCTNVNMLAKCLIDTEPSMWKVGVYELFIDFTSLPEQPRIGPLMFEVSHGTSADLPTPVESDDLGLPVMIPNCALWLDASRIEGLADGASVAVWQDSSLSNFDAIQPVAVNRPKFKTNILNGLPVVRFSDTPDVADNQYLYFTGAALDLFKGTSAFTLVVVTANILDFRDYVFEVSSGTNIQKRRVQLELYGGISMQFWGSDNDSNEKVFGDDLDIVNSPLVVGTPSAFLGAVDLIENKLFIELSTDREIIENTYPSSGAFPNTTPLIMLVGSYTEPVPGNGLSGDIAELIIYKRCLNKKERRQIMEYLSDKWNLL